MQTPETSANSCSAESLRAKHNISVKGLIVVPAPFSSFNDELPPEADAADRKSVAADGDNAPSEAPRKMPPWLLSRLEALGYKQPTPIQMQVNPAGADPSATEFMLCIDKFLAVE